MKIIVTIKQVPDTKDVEIDKKTGTLKREGVPSIINPEDRNAIEAALVLKEKNGGEVIVLTMGPPQAKEALFEALGMGVDKAYLVCDRAFAGADTLATAYTLSRAISKIDGFDMIICGRQAIDGDTAQVGPQLASTLNIPQITYAKHIEIDGKSVKVHREMDMDTEIVQAPMPVLITVTEEINHPRYPNLGEIAENFQKDSVTVFTVNDLDVNSDFLGLDGSPTWVNKTFSPQRYTDTKHLDGSPKEVVKDLISELKDKKVLEV
ncbi:electron transfer flavoprotein subunit beta/FixA family protein [bacterium]|nr:electron transfer flavoprotein subunit beta/FixA family protein [bacterium]